MKLQAVFSLACKMPRAVELYGVLKLDWGRIWLIPPERLVPSRLSSELAGRIAPHVVHSLLPTSTTKNHYGSYMSLIGAVTGVENQRGLARAIIKVGANARGVADGFKAATGVEL